ncbi:MAG: diguanylate cyclase, partial [Actinomycetota bacterium]|nr:diguanylate cyclase [Actinomycetota bacterium]
MASVRVRKAAHVDGDSGAFHESRPPRAVAALGPLAIRLSRWSPTARTLLLIEVVAAFVLVFGIFYVRLGPAVSLLSVLPVAIAGTLLGTRDGVRTALLVGIVNVLLFAAVGRWDDALRTSLPALIVLIPVGLTLGALRDLSVWIHVQASELRRRQRAMDSEVTERQSTELALTLRARQQSAVAALGHSALEGADLGTLLQEAINAIHATLEVEHCAAWELVNGGDALVRVGGHAPPEGLPLQQLHQTARTGEPCFVLAPVNGLVVQIAGLGRPFGVLTASTRAQRVFSHSDVHFMQTVANIVGTAIQRAWAEAAVAREASHDALTGLPNRTLFRTRLTQALDEGFAKPEPVGVMFLDLDDFKWINDGLGHTVGDQVLVAVGDALRSAVRPQDTAARLGGDEFTVLLRTPVDRTIVTRIAQRLIERLAEPLDLNGQEVSVTPSIGIALSDPALGSMQAEDLLRQADTAMYAAKMRGKARYSFFEQSQDSDDLLPLE